MVFLMKAVHILNNGSGIDRMGLLQKRLATAVLRQ